jgi:hypothetical protein
MNPIHELYNNISDDKLKLAIEELIESDATGFIKEDGYVRKYARLSGEFTGGFTTTDFFMTTVNLLKQGAFRWSKK